MSKDIFSLLESKYSNLSKTFKLIADYIKENYSTIPFLSIKELKDRIGVSSASITRFSQELGFSGYPAFQKAVQKVVEKEIAHMREVKSSISDSDEKDILKNTIDLNIEILKSTYSDDLYDSFNTAIELIENCKKVYILGLRSSYTVAYYLYYMLGQFMENIELLSVGTGDVFNKLAYINKEDILIAINFAQCTKNTSKITQYFKKNGNKIIAITDSYSSPVAIRADAVLFARNSPNTYSFVSAMTILNALIIKLGKINKDKTLNMLKQQEIIAIENDVYV